MKVYEILKKRENNKHIGIELECEFKKTSPNSVPSPWTMKGEGSLRHIGVEFITNGPIRVNDNKREKIKRLTDIINHENYGIIKDSPRTSLHVHVNILNTTPVKVWNQVVVFWLLENLLVKYCGETREGNLFCLRAKDAQYQIKTAIEDLQYNRYFLHIMGQGDRLRYASQNLASIGKFGTIEYRCMRGVTDLDTIDLWTTELHNMAIVSREFDNPEKIMDYYFSVPKTQFLSRFFSRNFVNRLTEIQGWSGLIDENVLSVCEIAYLHDWDAWKSERDKNHINGNNKPRNNFGEEINHLMEQMARLEEVPRPRVMVREDWNWGPADPAPDPVVLEDHDWIV